MGHLATSPQAHPPAKTCGKPQAPPLNMDHAKLANFHFNGGRRSPPRVCCWSQPPGLAGSRVFAADRHRGTKRAGQGWRGVRARCVMGQQGFEWGEQWGLEASRHTVHMWCGSSEYARAQGGGGGGGAVQKWMLWDVVLGVTREVGDAGRAPVKSARV